MSLRRADLFSLDGRTAVVTGATGFLGQTFVRTLLTNGARVVAIGRSPRLESMVADWSREFGEKAAVGHRVDMYDHAALVSVFEQVGAAEKSVDVLVNNAHELGPATGFNVADGAFESASLDQWARNIDGGIFWPTIAIQTLAPFMKAAGRASIVNIATMYATVAPNPALYRGTALLNPPGYSVAKAGLVALTRYVAAFWGPDNVRCNAILPGPFPNLDGQSPNSPTDDAFLKRLADRTCLGRVGRADELAGALLFLASDASTFVTGHALVVDGGWTIT